MDALKFIKIKNAITKNCTIECTECPFSWDNNNKDHMECDEFINKYPEEAVAIAKEWEREHPLKTRAQVFFEKFPDAMKNSDGRPEVCAKYCGLAEVCRVIDNYEPPSYCKKCWDEPAPDKYQEWGE